MRVDEEKSATFGQVAEGPHETQASGEVLPLRHRPHAAAAAIPRTSIYASHRQVVVSIILAMFKFKDVGLSEL